MAFNITTTAFEYGASIPVKHTCEGENISPPLKWDEAPKNTVTYAFIMEDPDDTDGTFTHWIVYNIPGNINELERTGPAEKKLENGAIQGKNDFGKTGYGGPCPPKGEEHRYFFRIFALKKKLPPESANTREAFYEMINDHVIDEASYMGIYRIHK